MLEAIIASGIIVTAVSSALTLVASSIKASKDSESSITAANLAREGIEVARSIRDSNWLSGGVALFDDGLHDGTDYSGIAVFDAATNTWVMEYGGVSVATDAPTRMYRYAVQSGNAVAGLFVQDAAQPADTVSTPFSRIILTEPLCDDGAGGTTLVTSGTDCGAAAKIGIRVLSSVQWTAGGGNIRSIAAEERMMDWR